MRLRASMLVSLAACLALAGVAPKDGPELRPGQETRVEEAKIGCGYFVVYVPSDYAASRRWPVVFCYHGAGGRPTVWPFREVTGGKGFIIVGLGYLPDRKDKMMMSEFDQYLAKELDSVKAAAAWLEARLRIDREQFFVGGFSMGGWMSSSMGEAAPALWAGIAILGAGRQKFDLPLKNPRSLRNKPIYIGCGDKDPNFPHAQKGAEFYRKAGATVTFEKYDGLGHQMKTDSEVLREWLLGAGPLRALRPRLAAARAAEQAGKLGKAYALYHELAQVSDADEACVAAAKAAAALAERAEAQLAEAEKAIAERRDDAPRLLAAIATRYEGSPFGDRADALIRKLQSQPGPPPAPPSSHDPWPARPDSSATPGAQAARECQAWLGLAENYLRAGKPDKAREYLARVIERHPDTEWATTARTRLAALEKAPR